MPSLVALRLNEANDEAVDLVATLPSPLDVAACDWELLIKTSTNQADDAATVLTLGHGLTVTSTGTTSSIELVAQIPAADLVTPGSMFWRLDLLVSAQRHTVMYGPLTIRNL